MTDAKHSYGTSIQVGSTTLAMADNITGPSITADQVDVSALDSTDAWKEFIAGLIDGGEVTIEQNMKKADFTAMLGYLVGRTAQAITLTYSGSLGVATFNALVTACTPGPAAKDAAIRASYTLKVTGPVTFT